MCRGKNKSHNINGAKCQFQISYLVMVEFPLSQDKKHNGDGGRLLVGVSAVPELGWWGMGLDRLAEAAWEPGVVQGTGVSPGLESPSTKI